MRASNTRSSAQNARDYAIVVGVHYPSLPPLLRAPRDDARAFLAWVRAKKGGNVPRRNTRALISSTREVTDNLNARPVQLEIDRALRDFGVGTNKPVGRRLYFYFSGHGVSPDPDDVAMMMATAAPGMLDYNVGLRHYRNFFLARNLFEEIIFICDCCRDVDSGQLSLLPQRPAITGVQIDNPAPSVKEFVVMGAPYGRQAVELTDPKTQKRRSLLTWALLEGLKSENALDPSGRITTETLRRYLPDAVQKLAAQVKTELGLTIDINAAIRMPVDAANEIVLQSTSRRGVSTVPVRIIAPAGLGGELIVKDSSSTVVDSRPASQVTADQPPWIVPLARSTWYLAVATETEAAEGPKVIRWPEVEANDNVFDFGQAR